MKLSPADRKNRERFEGQIRQGLDQAVAGFVAIGTALARIREGRLYRETHGTFEDYCQARWGFSRVRAHQLIEAACKPLVNNERQARELLGLSQEDARAVLAVAEASGGITAGKLKTARELLDEATKDKEGKEKREAQAEVLRTEAAKYREKKPSRIAGCIGLLKDVEKRLAWCAKKWSGLTDIADAADRQRQSVQRELDRLAEIIQSSAEEERLAA